jgi:hypothetical protein
MRQFLPRLGFDDLRTEVLRSLDPFSPLSAPERRCSGAQRFCILHAVRHYSCEQLPTSLLIPTKQETKGAEDSFVSLL